MAVQNDQSGTSSNFTRNTNNYDNGPRQSASSIFSAFSGAGDAIPKNAGNDTVIKIADSLKKAASTLSSGVKVSVLSIDQVSFTTLDYSSVVYATRYGADSTVHYFTFIIEATGNGVEAIQMQNMQMGGYQQGGVSTKYYKVPSEAFDGTFQQIAEGVIAKEFGSGVKIVQAGHMVVPADQNLFNINDPTKLSYLPYIASTACIRSQFRNKPGNNEVTFDEKGSPIRYIIDVNAIPGTVGITMEGHPIRVDAQVAISFSGSGRSRNNPVESNNGSNDTRLGVVRMFVQPEWLNRQQGTNSWGNPQPATQEFVPHIIANSLEFDLPVGVPPTTGFVMMVLMGMLEVGIDEQWPRCMAPVHRSSGRVDMRNWGALNVIADIGNSANSAHVRRFTGTPYDLKDPSFSAASTSQLMQALFLPTPIFSVDVLMGSSEWYYMSTFVEAARNNPAAVEEIYNTLNHITNGKFSQYMGKGVNIFANEPDAMIYQTWVDSNGVRRDTREFDLTAICNLRGDSEEYISSYMNARYGMNNSMVAKASVNADIERSLADNTAVPVGRIYRLTFSGEFVTAYSAYLRDNVNITVKSPSAESNMFASRNGFSMHGAIVTAPRLGLASGYPIMGGRMGSGGY